MKRPIDVSAQAGGFLEIDLVPEEAGPEQLRALQEPFPVD